MHVLDFGPADGEPVLMLHGYTDTSRSMLGTAERLAALRPDLRFIIPDQRGHGSTSLPSPDEYRGAPERAFTIGAFAGDAIELLDSLGLERVHLIGHSLGSFVSQHLALTHADRVRSMVLLGSAARTVHNTAIEQSVLDEIIERTWRPVLERKGHTFPDGVYELTPRDVDPDIGTWLLTNWVVEPLADPNLLAAIARETAQVPLGTWIGVARAVLGFDHRTRLAELSRPTLTISAMQDPICPVEPDQRELHEALAVAADRGVSIVERRYGTRPLPPPGEPPDDLGHNFQWAVAGEVARDIAAFYGSGAVRSSPAER
jgi:pimeloyl-ACP methyl ester carboxylesterase